MKPANPDETAGKEFDGKLSRRFDAWEPGEPLGRRRALNDSLPADYEVGALNENVLAKSLYAPQLARLFAAFDRSRVHVVAYESLVAPDTGPARVRALLKFLKLKPLKYQPDRIAAAAKTQERRRAGGTPGPDASALKPPDYRPILRKTRRLLEAFFTVDTELVRRMLPDVDLPW